MWVPLRLTPATADWLQVAARLKQGIALPQVRSAMQIVARQMEREDPLERAGLRIDVSPWSEGSYRKYELTLVFILVAVGLVLLIACADAGSLLLSRAVERQKEIAIRASLGAGRWRVARQLLAESFVLAVLGSVAGIAAARYVLQVLSNQLAALPIVLPHLQRVALNGRVLLFNTVLCLLLACLCSLAPVLSASRTDLQAVLRGGHAGGGPKGSTRLFSIPVGGSGVCVLAPGGLRPCKRSLVRLQQEDHGFRPDHVLTMRVPVGTRLQSRPAGKYDTRPRQMDYYHELIERLRRIPGIQAIAVVNNPPLSGVNSTTPLEGADGQPILVSTRTIALSTSRLWGFP